jgi:hypothetical protein
MPPPASSVLQFRSADRSRVELAAPLLRLAGVSAEVKKEGVSNRDKWYVIAYTDMLAAGHEGLRKAPPRSSGRPPRETG